MERYKLIEIYPGSPDLGTVVFRPHRESKSYPDTFKERNTRGISNYVLHHEDNIKKFPKFWRRMRKKAKKK